MFGCSSPRNGFVGVCLQPQEGSNQRAGASHQRHNLRFLFPNARVLAWRSKGTFSHPSPSSAWVGAGCRVRAGTQIIRRNQ